MLSPNETAQLQRVVLKAKPFDQLCAVSHLWVHSRKHPASKAANLPKPIEAQTPAAPPPPPPKPKMSKQESVQNAGAIFRERKRKIRAGLFEKHINPIIASEGKCNVYNVSKASGLSTKRVGRIFGLLQEDGLLKLKAKNVPIRVMTIKKCNVYCLNEGGKQND